MAPLQTARQAATAPGSRARRSPAAPRTEASGRRRTAAGEEDEGRLLVIAPVRAHLGVDRATAAAENALGLQCLRFVQDRVGPSSSHTMGPMTAACRFVERLRETGHLEAADRVQRSFTDRSL